MNSCASRPDYLVTERELGERFGADVPPLRVFNLKTFGINHEQFLSDLRPTFSILHLDPYDAKRNKVEFLKKRFPVETDRLNGFLADYYGDRADLSVLYDLIVQLSSDERNEFDRIGMIGRRKRSIARFILEHRHADRWGITRVKADHFQQSVGSGDPRALVRIFHEAEECVADHKSVRHLMSALGDEVRAIRPNAKKLQVNLHQMFIFADVLSAGDNSPEGIHQDGADFIVSALVIERAGIIGGESIVYGPDKKTEYLRRTLAEGEGIFQADKGTLWHYVTPIKEDPSVPPDFGHRSILGFDIDVME